MGAVVAEASVFRLSPRASAPTLNSPRSFLYSLVEVAGLVVERFVLVQPRASCLLHHLVGEHVAVLVSEHRPEFFRQLQAVVRLDALGDHGGQRHRLGPLERVGEREVRVLHGARGPRNDGARLLEDLRVVEQAELLPRLGLLLVVHLAHDDAVEGVRGGAGPLSAHGGHDGRDDLRQEPHVVVRERALGLLRKAVELFRIEDAARRHHGRDHHAGLFLELLRLGHALFEGLGEVATDRARVALDLVAARRLQHLHGLHHEREVVDRVMDAAEGRRRLGDDLHRFGEVRGRKLRDGRAPGGLDLAHLLRGPPRVGELGPLVLELRPLVPRLADHADDLVGRDGHCGTGEGVVREAVAAAMLRAAMGPGIVASVVLGRHPAQHLLVVTLFLFRRHALRLGGLLRRGGGLLLQLDLPEQSVVRPHERRLQPLLFRSQRVQRDAHLGQGGPSRRRGGDLALQRPAGLPDLGQRAGVGRHHRARRVRHAVELRRERPRILLGPLHGERGLLHAARRHLEVADRLELRTGIHNPARQLHDLGGSLPDVALHADGAAVHVEHGLVDAADGGHHPRQLGVGAGRDLECLDVLRDRLHGRHRLVQSGDHFVDAGDALLQRVERLRGVVLRRDDDAGFEGSGHGGCSYSDSGTAPGSTGRTVTAAAAVRASMTSGRWSPKM